MWIPHGRGPSPHSDPLSPQVHKGDPWSEMEKDDATTIEREGATPMASKESQTPRRRQALVLPGLPMSRNPLVSGLKWNASRRSILARKIPENRMLKGMSPQDTQLDWMAEY